MPFRPTPLPQDAEQLTRIILSLDEENADLKARVAFLEGQLFGPKSEKMTAIDPTQATLDLGDLSDIPAAANDDVAPVTEGTTPARRSPARNIGRLPKQSLRPTHPPLPRLDPGRKRTKLCQLWAQAIDDRPWNGPAPPAVAYICAESRSAREVEGQLSSFGGVLQVDGYQAYKTLAKRRGKSNVAPMRLAFCLAHARRKFVDVVKLTGSSEALSILARIAEIYRIEAKIRGESVPVRIDDASRRFSLCWVMVQAAVLASA
uniref:Uncharacterized protein n=2 Tax=Rhizobium meliloti TaxID=382 RepID=Q1WLG8_SINMM|nr:hypothetical protein [Sinorhizobium meliloti]